MDSIDSILTTDLSNVVATVPRPNYVPNQFPSTSAYQYRIAIIGDFPGSEEVDAQLPLVGAAGRHLWHKASRHGIVREACYVGNVVQRRQPASLITQLDISSPEYKEGVAELERDLRKYQPNLILCLGVTPLAWAMGKPASILSYRGTIFRSTLGFKAMATLHPSDVLRDYGANSLFDFDLKKAKSEGMFGELKLPERVLVTKQQPYETLIMLDDLMYSYQGKPVACDIEGYVDSMSCISFATSPNHSFIVPTTADYWGDLYPVMWQKLARYLSSPRHPKVLQNCLYDAFVLQYSYNIPVRGIVDDTMLKHWEMYCELDKNLALQTSIYTNEPYYKQDRKSEDKNIFYQYCCRDSAVTYEINQVLERQLGKDQLAYKHYRFNMDLLEPLLYMQLKGMNYDKTKANQKVREVNEKIHRLQWALNQIAGRGNYSKDEWFALAADSLCFKRSRHLVRVSGDILNNAKGSCLQEAMRVVELMGDPEWHTNASMLGELSSIIARETDDPDKKRDICLNVDSSQQIADFLYRESGLEVQYKKERGRKTENETTDVGSLLTLYKKSNDTTLKLILIIRGLLTRLTALETKVDRDGRIRCSYNLVGTETGRLSCSESATGSGFNLQTVQKKDRDLFLADEGYWFFQCDLAGADGWTVAAHCLAAGDSTMWDDYMYGLKPAKIIALLHNHGAQVNSWPREKLKAESKFIDSEGWLYPACKAAQHGRNYGLGDITMSDNIKTRSYKETGEPIIVPPTVCGQLGYLYLIRYPGVNLWHRKLKEQLATKGYLRSASGHIRHFFGRKTGEGSHETFRKMAADEPQNVTCYATNLALHKLWTDKENRYDSEVDPHSGKTYSDGHRTILRIQPLHQVHDALNGQFRKSDTEWAVSKIKEYFNTELIVAGKRVVIPFEGAYGPSWGQQGPKYGGGYI